MIKWLYLMDQWEVIFNFHSCESVSWKFIICNCSWKVVYVQATLTPSLAKTATRGHRCIPRVPDIHRMEIGPAERTGIGQSLELLIKYMMSEDNVDSHSYLGEYPTIVKYFYITSYVQCSSWKTTFSTTVRLWIKRRGSWRDRRGTHRCFSRGNKYPSSSTWEYWENA